MRPLATAQLMVAWMRSSIPTAGVWLLLDLGFDLDSRTSRDGTNAEPTLHVAVWRGRLEMVKLLVARGASLEAKNGGGATPPSLAVRALVEQSDWTPHASQDRSRTSGRWRLRRHGPSFPVGLRGGGRSLAHARSHRLRSALGICQASSARCTGSSELPRASSPQPSVHDPLRQMQIEPRTLYFRSCTTVVSVSAGSGVGSP
jgi:hypothetical protein